MLCSRVITCWERIWPWLPCAWCFLAFLSLSHMVSRVRCGTWLYWFLILAFFFTLNWTCEQIKWASACEKSRICCMQTANEKTSLHRLISTVLLLSSIIYTCACTQGAQWLSGRVLGPRVRASLASLHCGPWARHIYPSLVVVQPRKTRPCLTKRLLMGRKESKKMYMYTLKAFFWIA